MSQYAARTDVPVARSKGEIESVLARYGATAFAYGQTGDRAVVQFEARDRRVRFELPLPARPTRPDQERNYEQACRQRWRCLLLVVKAKLESVESGVEAFEDAFLAQLVLSNNQTVGQWARPQIALAYARHALPPMLPGVEKL